jgi:cephalosporin hydroxylase
MGIVDDYHKLYYDPRAVLKIGRPWRNVTWLGQSIYKMPSDMINYQELIYQVQPDFIIETGTEQGGSAFFFASILDFIGKGKVITIGINKFRAPNHRIFNERVIALTGDSVSEDIHNQIQGIIKDSQSNIVFLDSDHAGAHVLKELNQYSRYVQVGSYIVVEDSNINGHPVEPGFGRGPYEAIHEFLKDNNRFQIDKTWENKHLITFSVDGYLKRIK